MPPKPTATNTLPEESKTTAVELVTIKHTETEYNATTCSSSFWFCSTSHKTTHEQLEVNFEGEESKKNGASGARLFDCEVQTETNPAPTSATPPRPNTKSTCSLM